MLKASQVTVKEKRYWQITLEDKTAQMPKLAMDKPIEDAFDEDSSIAAKMVGMLYCKMMAEVLGGSFDARVPSSKGEQKGAIFVATLSKAGEP